ncbi:MAG: ATP-binding cassette domain-containing protein [Patulibacter sp.]
MTTNPQPSATNAALLRTRELTLDTGATPFDLEFPAGRIVGVAGLEGHGQDRLLHVLAGLTPPVGGTIEMDGEPLPGGAPSSLRDAFRHGIAYVPRDRKVEGIFPALSVLDNFAISTLREHTRFGIVNAKSVRRRFDAFADQLGLVTAGPGASIRSLSGGNQQKVLLARWLAAGPRVLLLNDPSRGVDHRTRLALYGLYRRVADEGAAIVLLSTEIEELLMVADEIVVFRDKSVSGRLVGDDRDRDRVLAAMFGVNRV